MLRVEWQAETHAIKAAGTQHHRARHGLGEVQDYMPAWPLHESSARGKAPVRPTALAGGISGRCTFDRRMLVQFNLDRLWQADVAARRRDNLALLNNVTLIGK